MIVSAHQPNLLPGLSVMTKMLGCDVWVWCDCFQYTRYGFTAKNVLANGTKLVVPTASEDFGLAIRDVRIGSQPARWKEKLTRSLQQRFGEQVAQPYVREIERPWRRLVGLNASLLSVLMDELDIRTPVVWQSHLSGADRHPVAAHEVPTTSVSERLAVMVAEVGGDVWLSGPSGRGYLDEQPFHDRGIEVRYWTYSGANHSAVEMAALGMVETFHEVADRLKWEVLA